MKKKKRSHETTNTHIKRKPFSSIFIVPMMVLTLLELIVFFLVLLFGDEFSSIKNHSYDILNEKTSNKKNVIESFLSEKTTRVHETGYEINRIVMSVLQEKGIGIDSLRSDKQLASEIISESAEIIIYLLRTNQVNDAFIILDTGDLYNSNIQKVAGFYIRDADISVNKMNNNNDLLVESGSSVIAREREISLDFEWSAQIPVGDKSIDNFDFFYRTINIAKENRGMSSRQFGNWNGFSKISRSAQPSIKYTVPLISNSGEVYGIVGIGILEKEIEKLLQVNDFSSQKACYMLAKNDETQNRYDVVSYSGAFYEYIKNDILSFSEDEKIYKKIFRNNDNDSVIYSIQDIDIYSDSSMFLSQKWAVISAVDRKMVMVIHDRLIMMLLLSSIISAFFCVVITIIVNRRISHPVKNMISTIGKYDAENNVLSFESSSIKEFDELAQSIVDLQVSVREHSSRVSKIISMADVGIGVFMYDMSGSDVFVGESLTKLFNLKNDNNADIIMPVNEFMEYIGKYDYDHKLESSHIFSKDNHKNAYDNIEIIVDEVRGKNTRWFKVSLTRENNNIIGLVQDTTNLVIEKKKIEYERDYDITTGLFNRRAFYDRIGRLFSEPLKIKTAAFVMLDLDNLKYVNDTYGHDFGDDYIKTAANILKKFRDYNGIVSRLSGDEFIVFLYGFDNKDDIRKIISDVCKKFEESTCILSDGTKYRVRASGGISWYPDDSVMYEMLIKYADFAMYEIKHSSKGNIAEFDMSSYCKDSILVTGVEEMNRIIDEENIRYAFQPIVSVQTAEIYGYESLMRPQSEVFKSPLEFIRIAKTGAKLYDIERLTWILALRQFGTLRKNGIVAESKKVFINSLLNCRVKDEDIEIIEKENMEYLSDIVLEFLESERSNEEYTKAKQNYIKKWNAMTAVDDFGSGYNSEYALISYNPDIVKIDRAIISGCDSDISRRSIIVNLVSIAKERNVLVLAEGVETYNEMKTVIECGVDLIQGYYIARPLFVPEPLEDNVIKQISNIYKSIN